MPMPNELLRRRPNPERSPEPALSEVHFKSIPPAYADMTISKAEKINPAEDSTIRLTKIDTMLAVYKEGLNERQFAHFVEDLIHIKGGRAATYEGYGPSHTSNENRQLIQTAYLGKSVDLISVAGVFTGPDVQVRLHQKLNKKYSQGVSFTLTENINVFSHDPSRQPQIDRKLTPLLPLNYNHLLPNEEVTILNDLGLEKEAQLNSEELHSYAEIILSTYKSSLPNQTIDVFSRVSQPFK